MTFEIGLAEWGENGIGGQHPERRSGQCPGVHRRVCVTGGQKVSFETEAQEGHHFEGTLKPICKWLISAWQV